LWVEYQIVARMGRRKFKGRPEQGIGWWHSLIPFSIADIVECKEWMLVMFTLNGMFTAR
jgi:hypothetical protein